MRPARYVPTICEDCDRYGSCEYDPADCEPIACERAAEERWDAAREARD